MLFYFINILRSSLSIITVIVIFSCGNESSNKINRPDLNIKYDGYVDPNSLRPGFFSGKYYLNLNIRVEKNNKLVVNGENLHLAELESSINKVWNIIQKDNYLAFLNIRLGNTKDAEFDFYTKVYDLINNLKRKKKDAYSKIVFQKVYSDLDKLEKIEVDKKILINIAESELE